jgi:acetoin utilization deacetylase AcuC-like enzyme
MGLPKTVWQEVSSSARGLDKVSNHRAPSPGQIHTGTAVTHRCIQQALRLLGAANTAVTAANEQGQQGKGSLRLDIHTKLHSGSV